MSGKPYLKIIKTKIPRELDRRIVLTDEIRERIKDLRKFEMSEQSIADDCGISRRTVRNALHPDEYEKLKQQSAKLKREGRYKPSKEKKAAEMKEYRHNKKRVLNYKKQKAGRRK